MSQHNSVIFCYKGKPNWKIGFLVKQKDSIGIANGMVVVQPVLFSGPFHNQLINFGPIR